MTSQICIIIAIVAYLGMMIYIGITYSKKNTQAAEFYLGGRKLGPLVTAMSAEASDMSSYLLMGLPGLAYIAGLAEVGWTAIGLAIGTYLNWLFVSRRIRRYSSRIGSFTIPEFFAKRYGDDRHFLTCIAAVIIVVFFVPYTASGFAACGKLFSTLFGMNYIAAMLLSAAVIVIYCTLGGFLAVSTTDLIQGITMSIALLIVVGYRRFWRRHGRREQSSRLLKSGAELFGGNRHGGALYAPYDCLHSCMGTRIFRYAPHPAPLHGN